MSFLITVVAFVVALGCLIVIHEYGHYMVARLCNVKVLRFSVGFGKPLRTWVRGPDRTEWVIAAIPLGGYVKMLDEREGPVAPAELSRAFNRQSVWRRIAIVSAGPIANLLLAVALYWGLFMYGVPGVRPVIGAPVAASAAERAGFSNGEIVTAVDSEQVQTWQDARWTLLQHAVQKSVVSVEVLLPSGNRVLRKLDMSSLTAEDLDGDFMRVLGFTRFQVDAPAEVGRITSGGAAERAGLRSGDEIVKINDLPVRNVEQVIRLIRENPGRSLIVEIRRGDSAVSPIQLVPESVKEKDGSVIGRIGAALQPLQKEFAQYRVEVKYGVLDALGKAFYKTWDTSLFSLKMLGKMLVGEVSLKNLSGPITIADYAGQSAQNGLASYLVFLALISISLGVLNLLPIPLLDGGHLMYYIIEIFKGAPVSEQVAEVGQRIGLGLLMLMMAFALYNDVYRLISG